MHKPRIFITNDNGQDFSEAEKYGEIVKLTAGGVNPFSPQHVQKTIGSVLTGFAFDGARDFVLIAGNALSIAFTFAWLAVHADDGRNEDNINIKLLLFDVKKRVYIERTVTI